MDYPIVSSEESDQQNVTTPARVQEGAKMYVLRGISFVNRALLLLDPTLRSYPLCLESAVSKCP
jgi:hypothetical protein